MSHPITKHEGPIIQIPGNGGGIGYGRAADEDVHLIDVWNVIRRHLWMVLGVLATFTGLAVFYASRAVPVYESSVSIRIDDKTSNLPALDILKSLSASGNQVSTEMQVLQSRTLAEEALDSLGLQVTLMVPKRVPRSEILRGIAVLGDSAGGRYTITRRPDGRFDVSDDSLKTTVTTVGIGQPVSLRGALFALAPAAASRREIRVNVEGREERLARFKDQLKVSRPDREANVVVVTYQSPDKELVREVPNLLARRFISRRQVVQQTEARSTVRFLKEQIDTLSTQLTQSENALKTFRQNAGVVSLADEASASVSRLADLKAQRTTIDGERSALVSLLTEVNAEAKAQKPDDPSPYRRLIAFPTLLRNQAASALLASLATVDDQRAALLVRRTPNDPDVQVLTSRMHDIERQLHDIATTYAQGLTNQVAALDGTLAQFGRQMQQVPAKEIEFARVARGPKILEEIYTLLQTRLKEAEVAQAVEDPSVRVVDPAVTPFRPISPKKKIIVLFGLFGGLMAGVGLAFMREYMDHTVHTREEIQQLTGVAVLGLIPRIQTEGKPYLNNTMRSRFGALMGRAMPALPAARNAAALRVSGPVMTPLADRLVTGNDPRSPVSEAYRSLRTNITFARPDAPARVIAFTSAMPSEGKSTSSANLAITLAQQGLRVLLVDADLRRGLLNEVFGFARDPGLSNCLMGYATVKDAVKRVQLPENATMDFLPTGTLPPNPAELLGSARMKGLLQEARDSYDMVIFDTPPTNLVTDAAVVGSLMDGVVVVARAAVTRSEGLAYAMDLLRQVRAPVLGVVLNDIDFKRDAAYYGAYGSGYYYYAAEPQRA